MRALAAALVACGVAGGSGLAWGRVLVVGEGGYPTVAAAVGAAQAGDTVHIRPGQYYECAVIGQPGLVIEGEGDGSVLTDRVCEEKAVLVIRSDGVTVRSLVLARARSPDANGAGIRLEGQGLTLDGVRFDNDQMGLLAAGGGLGRITVVDCTISGGGGVSGRAALAVGPVALLRVAQTRFSGFRGSQVASEADWTELEDDRIEVGTVESDSIPVRAGQRLVMRKTVIALGPHAPPRGAAVVAMGTGAVLEGNRLENGTGAPATLLLDWGGGARAEGNVVAAGDTAVSTDGAWRHWAGGMAHGLAADARSAAGSAKRGLKGLLGR